MAAEQTSGWLSLSSPLLQPDVATAFGSSASEHAGVPQTTAACGP